MRPRTGPALAALLLTAVLLAGCADSGTQQVSNSQDSFRYTGDWKTKVGTDRYTWKNTKGMAEVSAPASADFQGGINVRINDANGANVYEGLDGGAGIARQRTLEGKVGDWTIELAFDAFKGHVDVSVRAVEPPNLDEDV